MRSFWLTLLLAFALVAGGLATAGMAAACPMETAAAAHDCCPDDAPPAPLEPADDGKDAGDCAVAQLCRTATILAPEPGPAHPAMIPIAAGDARVRDVLPAPAPLAECWRPPRPL